MIGMKFKKQEKYKIIVMTILLTGACFLTYYSRKILETRIVFTHFFYIPIILGALWWKRKGLIVAIFLAAFLIFSHIFFRLGMPTADDYLRTLMFIVIGFVVAMLSEQIAKVGKMTELAYTELNQIFHTAGDGMRVIDKDFNVLRVNKIFSHLSGMSEDETIGKKCYEVFPGPLCHTPGCTLTRILKGEERVECDVEKERRDGTKVPCIVTATPLRGPDDKLIGIVENFKDITERKRAEEEKKRIQAQLFQSQKMEAIGILTGGIAHDFNNLLAAIQTYIDLSMRKVDKVDPLYENLKKIRLTTVRAANLIHQLLLFSRKQPMQFTSFNINRTIDDLLKMLTRLVGENISIDIDLESNLWMIRADKGNIEQMVMNLIVNARDAMSKGGKLNIKTENVILNEETCKVIPESRPGRFIRLSVVDTGIGMDKATIDQIFEPFFSTKEPGKGTGIGLSVVYGIVKQHEGWINVYSKPGQGSTFKIYLPALLKKG